MNKSKVAQIAILSVIIGILETLIDVSRMRKDALLMPDEGGEDE